MNFTSTFWDTYPKLHMHTHIPTNFMCKKIKGCKCATPKRSSNPHMGLHIELQKVTKLWETLKWHELWWSVMKWPLEAGWTGLNRNGSHQEIIETLRSAKAAWYCRKSACLIWIGISWYFGIHHSSRDEPSRHMSLRILSIFLHSNTRRRMARERRRACYSCVIIKKM